MKKRILAAIITAVMVIVMIPFTAFAEVTIPTFDTAIGNITELNTLFANGGSGYLTTDIEATDYLIIKGNKTADLNLKGYNINLNEKNITLGTDTNDIGTLNLYDTVGTGTISNGSGTDGKGGAIYIRYGDFSMYGGTIKDCNAYAEGGAVNVYQGTFNMNKGSIIKNCTAASDNWECYGGAVFLEKSGANFKMNGGTIDNCTADNGGAVYIKGGSFHMYGGLLSGNEAFYGGAVYNESPQESFHMHGGEISGNKAVENGGGVFNRGDCSFDGKCVVKDNYSYQRDDKKMEDNKIRDNVCICDEYALLTIGNSSGKDSLEDESEIWVTLSGRTSGAITASGQGGKESETKYFRSDVDAYYVVYDKDAECMELVSRITQQPTPDNHYTVKIKTDDLGYTDPAYQWYLKTVTSKNLDDIDDSMISFGPGGGSKGPEANTVHSSDWGSIFMGFSCQVVKTTFTSTDTELESGPALNLKSDGEGNYYFNHGKIYLGSRSEFKIENVVIDVCEMEKFDDNDATLNGGEEGKAYCCRITYKDGSYEDSRDVTVVAHGDHDWSYSLSKKVSDNDTIMAICDGKGECDYKGTDKELTISASDALYDGKAHGAALSGKTLAGVAEKDFPVIQYEKKTSENKYDKATIETPKEAGKYRASITVGEDEKAVTAYVEYEIKEVVTITFDANGGSGSMDKISVEKGSAVKLPENSFKAPDGKKFKSWSIDGQTYNAGSEVKVTKDIIVKAEWEANAVTADFASFWVYLMIAGFALASIGYGALKLTKKSGR